MTPAVVDLVQLRIGLSASPLVSITIQISLPSKKLLDSAPGVGEMNHVVW